MGQRLDKVMATSGNGQSAESHQPRPPQTQFWLWLSLAIALLYRLPPLHNAFSADFVVQDDARQHVFWMQRFTDADLFPNDFIADYFQSVAPWGYTTLYKVGVALGFDVWTFNKILPLAIAGVATLFAFGTIMELVQMPVAAFIGTTFLNQTFPLRDDIVSATPAAFFHPLFLAFLYFTLRCAWLPCALSVGCMGLFYPQGVLVMAGTLALLGLSHLRWQSGKLKWHGKNADLWLVGSSFLAAFLVLLPYALRDSAYGPVLTLEQAHEMFALSHRGWSKFFDHEPLDFWLFGKRTGIFPFEWGTLDLKVQPQIWLTVAIPFLLWLPGQSPFAKQVAPRVSLLLQVVIASLVCYGLAHLFLFELHLPNRYTEHSFRAIAAIGSGVAVALILDRGRRAKSSSAGRKGWWGLLVVWAIAPLVISLMAGESRGNYIHGQYPDLYRFLASQPKTTVTASLDATVNELPSFTQRSIFVGGEGFTLPYHLGYYNEVKRRSIALIEAQYTRDPEIVRDFLTAHAIDLWLVSDAMFTPEWITTNQWFLQYSEDTSAPREMLNSNQPTVIQQLIPSCEQARFGDFRVLSVSCLQTELENWAS